MARVVSLPRVAAFVACAGMSMSPVPLTARGFGTESSTFSDPAVLKNISTSPHTVEVNLTAAPKKIEFLPGKPADGYAYNGMVPGPTLEAHEGDHVIVHFHNNLSEPTTIHWHGLHIPAVQDGSPLSPILPGKSHDYVFTIQRGTAGTYWYHPHPDEHTGRQIGLGLFGGIVIRPAVDPLPKMVERVIILSDNRFNPDGSVDLPGESSDEGQVDLVNGREGKTLFVSGQFLPTIPIRSGELQRWRIINASAARIYRLSLGGQTFTQVGSDGGLFEHPVDMKEITVVNSERVEIVVRGTGAPGSAVKLQALPYDRYVPQTRPSDWDKVLDLATIKYSDDSPVAPVMIPSHLRVVPPIDTLKATRRRYISFSQGLINGKTMDMHRIDIHARLGATEIWQVENLVGMDHPFHLHGFQFQVIDRNGVPEKDRRWKDTMNVPKHQYARFVVRFDDFPGEWMYHCHILDHEDHGMMGILEVK